MADREKVIKGLECCSKDVRTCEVCPYDKEMEVSGCDWDLLRDSLELLKEQAEIVRGNEIIRCRDCARSIPPCNGWERRCELCGVVGEDHFCGWAKPKGSDEP